MKSNLSFKRLVCVSLSLSQILSTSVTSLVAADLRVRDNHIVPLHNDPLAPQVSHSANGREAVNILNPNSKGISHNKYESFDIAKDNGVILNNSMKNGVSLTGGVVNANPNLSSEARLIINEIVSKQQTSLEGTLEVFGKNADVIIANENGMMVNGATFINTSGVTLTTGLIDRFNHSINVRGGNISILQRGVGLDGDYFSIISQSMQLAGNIAKLDGKPLDRMNYIAGLNNIKLDSSMKDPQIISTFQSEENKPKLAIDGDMLGSMYAGYIKFLSTQQGVGVQHKGVIKSADDIVIDANGDILTSALIAQNIALKTSSDVINDGVIIGNKNLDIDAKALTNKKDINTETILKARLDLNKSYIQAENANLNLERLDNQGKMVGLEALNIKSLGDFSLFENSGDMISQNIKIQTNAFKNNASITSNNADLDVSFLTNTGKIASENNLIISFKDSDKSLNQVLQNEKGTLSSKNILKFQSGTIKLDKTLGNITADGKLAFSTNKDIVIQKDFINKGSLELKALGNITNNASVLLASSKDLYLSAKAFLNKANAYVFGDNIKIEADNITNNQNAVIDARNILYLKSDTLINNVATINSGSDLNIITNTLNNNGITNGDIKFNEEPNLRLSYYFAKDYFGNRNFSATAKTYSIQNNLENKQAIIKSGGNLYIQSDERKNTDVYNSNSLIAAKKDIQILGNIYNTTIQKGYDVGSLLENFYISDITAVATYLGGGTYKIGKGGAITVLNKAFYANDDNQGYFGLLKDLAAKNNLFKSLMARAFGVDWIMAQNPWQLKQNYKYNPNAFISFTPKNPAQIIAGNNIVIKGGAIYNSTGSESKIKTDIDTIKTNLKDIQITQNPLASTSLKNPPISDSTSTNKKTKNIFESIRLTEKQIMDLGKSVLFQTKEFNPNVAINYYIETRPDLVDMDKFYGSQYLFSQISYEPQKPLESKPSAEKSTSNKSEKLAESKPLTEQIANKSQKLVESKPLTEQINKPQKLAENKSSTQEPSDKLQKFISIIGDAYYENKLLNEQLTRNLGYTNTLSPDDVKNLLDNAAVMSKKLGLVVGKALNQEQIEQLDNDIVWYVSEKIGGREVLVPQLYFSKNTSFNKTDEAKNSTIASSGNMFLQTGTLKNDDGSFIAAGSLEIKSVDTNNIGGVIAAQNIAIDTNKLISESKIDIDEKGNLTTVKQASISANKDISVLAQDDITIKNALVSSQSNGSKVNLVAKNGSIQIIDDEAHTSNYVQTTLEKDDYLEVNTSMQKQTFSSGSLISGSTINIQSSKDLTLKGSSLSQTSKGGSINLSALGDVNIVSGDGQIYSESTRYFSGVNEQTGMREYATYAQATQNIKEALASSIKASGDVNIISQNNLNIESSEINSEGKVTLNALGGEVTLKDAQNVSTLNTSDISYQVLGIKGGNQTVENSTSSGSKIKANGGFAVASKGDIHIIGSDLEAKDILLSTEGKFIAEAGKSTSKVESNSFAFGIIGRGKAGIASSEVSSSFGIDDNKNSTSAQSAFQPESLASGKIQVDSLATSELGLEFSWQNATQSSTTYKNANLKTSNGDLVISAAQSADIGGSNMDSASNIVLRAEEILSSKYTDEVLSHNFGFNIALTQKVAAVSAVADAINMVSDLSVSGANKENLNGAFVAAQAIGAATNLIFNDLIGGVSTQELSLQIYNQDSHKTSQNINQITAAKGIQFESTKGNIELAGVKMKADSLNLISAKDIVISNALETIEENGFSVGLQARVQESVGYSVLWGANGDVGVGGGLNFAYNQNSEQKSQASEFEIKNQANLKAQNDLALIGSKITAGSLNADIGGDLRIVSALDIKNSQNANANLGADVSLGGAGNTIAKGDVSLNAGAGHYHDNSKSVGVQAGILTQGKLNINAKGDALLEGAILSSATKQGGLNIGGALTINDLDLYKDKGGGSASLSGGMSGNFGGHVNLGDNESQTSRLYSAIDISVNAQNIAINGTESSVKDIYTDTQNSNVVLSGDSFVGGNMSFSGNMHKIKSLFGNKPESSQSQYQDDPVVGFSFNEISDLPQRSESELAGATNHPSETSQGSPNSLLSKIKRFFSTENYYDVTDPTMPKEESSRPELPVADYNDPFVVRGTNGFVASAEQIEGLLNVYPSSSDSNANAEPTSQLPQIDHNNAVATRGDMSLPGPAQIRQHEQVVSELKEMFKNNPKFDLGETSRGTQSELSAIDHNDPLVVRGNNGFVASTKHISDLIDNSQLPFGNLFNRNSLSSDSNANKETHSPSDSIIVNPYHPSSYVEASFAPLNDTRPSLLSRFKNLFSKKPTEPLNDVRPSLDSISYVSDSSTPLNETHSPSDSIIVNPYHPSSYVEASFAPLNDTHPSLLSRFKNLFSKKPAEPLNDVRPSLDSISYVSDSSSLSETHSLWGSRDVSLSDTNSSLNSRDVSSLNDTHSSLDSISYVSGSSTPLSDTHSSLDNPSIHPNETSKDSKTSLLSRIKNFFSKKDNKELVTPKEEPSLWISNDTYSSLDTQSIHSNGSSQGYDDPLYARIEDVLPKPLDTSSSRDKGEVIYAEVIVNEGKLSPTKPSGDKVEPTYSEIVNGKLVPIESSRNDIKPSGDKVEPIYAKVNKRKISPIESSGESSNTSGVLLGDKQTPNSPATNSSLGDAQSIHPSETSQGYEDPLVTRFNNLFSKKPAEPLNDVRPSLDSISYVSGSSTPLSDTHSSLDNPSIHPNETSKDSKTSLLSRIKNFFSKKDNKELATPKEEPSLWISNDTYSSLDAQSIHSSETSQESQKSLFSRIKEQFLKEYAPIEEPFSGDLPVSNSLDANAGPIGDLPPKSQSVKEAQAENTQQHYNKEEAKVAATDEVIPKKEPYKRKYLDEFLPAPLEVIREQIVQEHKETLKNNNGFDLNETSRPTQNDGVVHPKEPYEARKKKYLEMIITDDIKFAKEIVERNLQEFKKAKSDLNEISEPTQNQEHSLGDSGVLLGAKQTSILPEKSRQDNGLRASEVVPEKVPYKKKFIPGALEVIHEESGSISGSSSLSETHSSLDNPSIHPNETSKDSKTSLLSRIKNFFSKKDNKELVTPKEEPSLWITNDTYSSLDAQSIHSNGSSQESQAPKLPPKSDYVINEQSKIVLENNSRSDEYIQSADILGVLVNDKMFKGMFEKVIPPRVPLDKEYKLSDSDRQDLKDSLDMSINGVSDISFHQNIELAKSLSENPVFKKTLEDPNAKHQLQSDFNLYLSEIRTNLNANVYPEAKDLAKSLNNIYVSMNTQILNNNRIKEAIETSNFSKKDDFKIIFQEVMNEYREAFKNNTGLDFGQTKMDFSNKYTSAEFDANSDIIHIPSPKKFKETYLSKDSTDKDTGLKLLEAAVHEMTHKQQDFLIKNKDSLKLDPDMRNYAQLLDLNRQSYLTGENDFNLYKNQVIEREAFSYGQETAKSFQTTHKIPSEPIRIAPQSDLLKISGASPNANSSAQNVFSMLASPRGSLETNSSESSYVSSSSIPLNEHSSLDNPQSTHSNEAWEGSKNSLLSKIKNFFSKKTSYDVKDLKKHLKRSEEKPIVFLSTKNVDSNLPPKSQSVREAQAEIAQINAQKDRYIREQAKFASMGEAIPPRIPLDNERKPSVSDKEDLKNSLHIFTDIVSDISFHHAVDVAKIFSENPVFKKTLEDRIGKRQLQSNLNFYLSEIRANLHQYPETRDLQTSLNNTYRDLNDRILNNNRIKEVIETSSFSKKDDFKIIFQEVMNEYREAFKNNMGFDFGNTRLKIGDKYKTAHFNPGGDKGIYVPKPKQFKDEYMLSDSSYTEVGLMALQTAVHEMTHKQQDFFAKNKDNPQFDQSMKDYALLLDLNRRFYLKGSQNINLYKTQVIETEAFSYGQETAKSFQTTHNIPSKPIKIDPQHDLLKISGASPNANSSTENVFSMLPFPKEGSFRDKF